MSKRKQGTLPSFDSDSHYCRARFSSVTLDFLQSSLLPRRGRNLPSPSSSQRPCSSSRVTSNVQNVGLRCFGVRFAPRLMVASSFFRSDSPPGTRKPCAHLMRGSRRDRCSVKRGGKRAYIKHGGRICLFKAPSNVRVSPTVPGRGAAVSTRSSRPVRTARRPSPQRVPATLARGSSRR